MQWPGLELAGTGSAALAEVGWAPGLAHASVTPCRLVISEALQKTCPILFCPLELGIMLLLPCRLVKNQALQKACPIPFDEGRLWRGEDGPELRDQLQVSPRIGGWTLFS